MTAPGHAERVPRTVAVARRFTEQGVPVILLQHGLKKPLIDSSGTWLTVDDPDDAETAIKTQSDIIGYPNLGILLHPKGGSNIICVDVDGADLTVVAKLKACGVTGEKRTWRQSTGKRNGHAHIFYRWDKDPLPRIADKPDGVNIDLLTKGYAVVAPSDTYRESDGGGPYAWLEGRSIFDISVSELAQPPDALVDWWLSRKAEVTGHARLDQESGGWLAWVVNSPINDKTRNVTLAKIAGSLRRRYGFAETVALLRAINQARCTPPLDENEVARIAASIDRRENGKTGRFRSVSVAPMGDSP